MALRLLGAVFFSIIVAACSSVTPGTGGGGSGGAGGIGGAGGGVGGGAGGGGVCGDDSLDGDEVCDGTALNGETCSSRGFDSGHLACAQTCDAFITAGCFNTGPECGNDIREEPELCDGSDLAGWSCVALGYDGGEIACAVACDAFVITGCGGTGPVCGDDMAEGLEVCDGTDLRGESCISRGYDGGTLSCNATCDGYLDLGTSCTGTGPVCGDDDATGGEVCDGADLRHRTCMNLGFIIGDLACKIDCHAFDTSDCVSGSFCGNHAIEGGEICDGIALAGEDCSSQGFEAGTLRCVVTCDAFDTENCYDIPEGCGDGIRAGDEVCDGDDLGGKSCADLGFAAGILRCTPSCTGFDSSSCGAANGDACDHDDDCASGYCWEGGTPYGYPGGYCSEPCWDDGECDFGGVCAYSYCYSPCDDRDDCRAGYACRRQDGIDVCLPGCGGERPCSSPREARCDPVTLMCEPCLGDPDCGNLAGLSHCLEGACVQCLDAGNCNPGQTCVENTCFGGQYGDFCTDDFNCLSGFCLMANLTAGLEGVCSQPCFDDGDCPTGSICDGPHYDGYIGELACLIECEASDDCPGSLICADDYFGVPADGRPRCIQRCASSYDCRRPESASCDPSTGVCAGCQANVDCAGIWYWAGDTYVSELVCDEGTCVQCVDNADCSPFQYCDQNVCRGMSAGGGPCESWADCIDGECLGFPGGYCSNWCWNDPTRCGADEVCTNGYCLVRCDTSDECRDGYTCTDGYWGSPDGVDECVPGCLDNSSCSPDAPRCESSGLCGPCLEASDCEAHAAGGLAVCLNGRCVQCSAIGDCEPGELCLSGYCAGPIGSACDDYRECLSYDCRYEEWFDGGISYPGGYCSSWCNSDGDCSGEGHCSTASYFCYASCATADDCRSGYICQDVDWDGRDECVPACQENRDCTPQAPVCGAANGMCGPCADDPGCALYDWAPYCLAGSCVECINAGDCGPDQICDAQFHCHGSLPTGKPCADSDVCIGGWCRQLGWSGGSEPDEPGGGSAGGTDGGSSDGDYLFPGGYCSEYCEQPGDCPSGGHCSLWQWACYASCTINDDCRPGYRCDDFDGDNQLECVPNCVTHTQCDDPSAARCDITHGECAGCLDDAECFHLGLARCLTGLCVECISDPDCASSYQLCMGDHACAGISANGGPCASSQDCAGDYCVDEEYEGFPGGYCVQWCENDDHCTEGGICADYYCVAGCTTAGDCRAGYVCSDRWPGRMACTPACTSNGDCGDRQASRCDLGTGKCEPCQAAADCQQFTGYPVCDGGACVRCTDASHCNPGQECQDNRCLGTLPNGAPCTREDVCAGDRCLQYDYLEFPGGYCSEYCGDMGFCPAGGHCFYNYWYCLADCDASSDCRDGYICEDFDDDGASECLPACDDNGDCPNVGASRCETSTGMCEACLVDGDCAHVWGTHACENGRCVECRDQGQCGPEQSCVELSCVGILVNGEACDSWDVCAGDTCLMSWNGYPNGYCTQWCWGEDQTCLDGAGGHCVLEYCMADCAGSNECRDGYVCVDKDGDGSLECAPPCIEHADCHDRMASRCEGGTGECVPCAADIECAHFWNANICEGGLCVECREAADCLPGQTCQGQDCVGVLLNGEACFYSEVCAGEDCRSEEEGFPGGYCTQWCGQDYDCWAGGHCDTYYGMCVADCDGNGLCRPDYICVDHDGLSPAECWPACRRSSDCMAFTASRCDANTGSCEPCIDDVDCEHVGDYNVCDSGQCVQCRGPEDCGPNQICDFSYCYGTLATGEPCQDWSECRGSQCLTEYEYGFPSGYCSAWCWNDSDCDYAGGHCYENNWCMKDCTVDADCRSDYACIDSDGSSQWECLPQ